MTLPFTEEQKTELQLAEAQRMALLWMRTSAEYRALCYQGYNAALVEIARAQANPAARSGKPLAIVLDCDETVVDNTRALAEAAAAGNGRYNSLWWRATISEARSEAMPGAADFLNEVARRGVAIFYVGNRWSEVNYEPTVQNLKELGFPSVDAEHILLRDDLKRSDKEPRFDAIAENYDIALSTWATTWATSRSTPAARRVMSATPSSTRQRRTSARATSSSRTPSTAHGSARCQGNI